MAVAACDANSIRTSSSALVNSSSGLLLGEKEVADEDAPVAHRRTLEGLRAHQVRRKAKRAHIAGKVRQPHRALNVPEVLEEPRPLRPTHQFPALVGREAGGDEVFGLSCLVDRHDRPEAGAGQDAGAVDDLLEDGIEVKARADAQDGGAQSGKRDPGAPRSAAADPRNVRSLAHLRGIGRITGAPPEPDDAIAWKSLDYHINGPI